MKFKNIDNWKAIMKKIAKERNLDIQDVQQRFVLEEFALKISNSKYSNQFVLKGGFIISTLLGLDTRMTRDLDLTCLTSIYKEEEIKKIIIDIIDTPIDSFFEYFLINIRQAQKDDYYSGYVVILCAKQGKSEIKLKLDISNNTLIYPYALDSSLQSLFGDEPIKLITYSLENIIAEKFETTLDRGEFNGRMRDLVDVYLLMKDNAFMIDDNILADTIIEVLKDRDTLENLDNFDEIIEFLNGSSIFIENFNYYINEQYPDNSITLEKVINQFKIINKTIIDFRKSK